MPKIDWFDDADDQPRWEPRHRMYRERIAWREAMRRWPAPGGLPAPSPGLITPPLAGGRRPLHLIWGEPRRSAER